MIEVRLGRTFPTDCTMVLMKGLDQKEYAIESVAWQLLDRDRELPNWLGHWIWNTRDKDMVEDQS